MTGSIEIIIEKAERTERRSNMLIDVETAAKALNVSESFLRNLVRSREIPCYKLSPRTTRFDLEELRAHMRLLATGALETKSEQSSQSTRVG